MLNMLKVLILLLSWFAIDTILPVDAKSDEAAVREMLVTSKNVKKIIAIDDRHTWVSPLTHKFTGNITTDFIAELVDICYKSGGKFEKKEIGKDEFTNQPYEKWVEVSKDQVSKLYISLDSVNTMRCSGSFSFAWIYKDILINQHGDDVGRVKSFTIRHNSPQPFTYKNDDILIKGNLEMLKEGDLYAELKGKLKNSVGGLFGNLWPSDEDVFQYISALCVQSNGKLRSVVSNNSGLTEVSLPDAFHYIRMGGHEIPAGRVAPAYYIFGLYLFCDGENKFAAKLNHKNSETDPRKYTVEGLFKPNRGLEGLQFRALYPQ